MKKLIQFTMLLCLLLAFVPVSLKAQVASENTEATIISNDKTAESAKANALLLRLYEIKAMDKSTLTAEDKKSLRKEVRSIKTGLKETSGGIYLSVGAIIVIILLLILILR